MLIHKFTFDDYCLLVVSELTDIPHDVAASYIDTTEYDYEMYDGSIPLLSVIDMLRNSGYSDFCIIYVDTSGNQYEKLFFSYHTIENCSCTIDGNFSEFDDTEDFFVKNYTKLQSDIEIFVKSSNIGCKMIDEGIDISNDVVYFGTFEFYTNDEFLKFKKYMDLYSFENSNFTVNYVYINGISEIELIVLYIDNLHLNIDVDLDWENLFDPGSFPFPMDCDYFSEN